MGPKKQVGPTGLCVYFTEIQERDGISSVPTEFVYLVQKCIEDKIFCENGDLIAVCRSDNTSAIEFVPSNWDGVKKTLSILKTKRELQDGGSVENPISCLDDVCNGLIAQAAEDSYESKKLLFFASLSSYIIDENDVKRLAEKLLHEKIFISIILPDEADMTEIQKQNSDLIKKVFDHETYDDISMLTTLTGAKCQILNTLSRKKTRPSAWNVVLEISPEITIHVGGYPCTRKNKSADTRRALMKQGDSEISNSQTVDVKPGTSTSFNNGTSLAAAHATPHANAIRVDLAKNVLETEKFWTGTDGERVDDDDVGKGYYFGDKIIPFNDNESEGSYRSGEKCLKLLVFCPIEKIKPAFLTGDGTTVFYPKTNDTTSEVKFQALMQAMKTTERIAVVRKVYRKDSRPAYGTLVLDEDRKCLVYSELSFADDMSVPKFPLLIKQEDLAEENEGLNEKESLIDSLISSLVLEFNPCEGPADPAVAIMRNTIVSKILKEEDTKEIGDNIDLFFQNLVVDDDILSQLRESFPLTVKQQKNERLAGSNVFNKRPLEDATQNQVEKRLKSAEVSESVAEEQLEVEVENENEMDDLLDEL